MNTPETVSRGEDILNIRAEKYAALPDEDQNRTIIDTVVVLGVGKQKFGIPIDTLEVIIKTPPIAHLPGLPPLIRGTLQNRGELLAAVDIARWYDIESKGEEVFLAVIGDADGRKLGLLVDEVLGFKDIAEDDLVVSFFGNTDRDRRPISATTRDLIAIIDVRQLFENPNITLSNGPGKR